MPTSNRKVIHLVYSLGYGGLEQVIVNLINNSTHYNVHHVVVTLTNEQDLYDAIKVETPIYSLDKKPGKDLTVHWKLLRLLHTLKADVLHTYNFSTIEYHWVASLAGVKTRIHCEHGRGGDDQDGMNRWHNLLRKSCIPLLDRFIVVSPDLFQWAKDILKIRNGKLQIIHNGVNINQYHPSAEKFSRYTICTVGRTDPVKNQKLLIDAIDYLNKKHPEFKQTRAIIIGDGPIFNELQLQVEHLGLERQVKLFGYRNDVPDILNRADLFVLCSVYEAMPMTILEAMACELPVIVTNVGGIGHMVSRDVAWLIESNNMEQLASTIHEAHINRKSGLRKAELGRKLVEEKYSIENMVHEYMSLYQCEII